MTERIIKKKLANQKIGDPKIGACLGKCHWKVMFEISTSELKGEDHTLVEYVLK